MSQQTALFHEDIWDALRTDIMSCGGMKVVGLTLFPEKGAKAGDYLSTCLNPARPEKLDVEQIMVIKRMAKQHASFATHRFEESDLGMTAAQPIEPDDEKARLQRDFITAVQSLESIKNQITRLDSGNVKPLRA